MLKKHSSVISSALVTAASLVASGCNKTEWTAEKIYTCLSWSMPSLASADIINGDLIVEQRRVTDEGAYRIDFLRQPLRSNDLSLSKINYATYGVEPDTFFTVEPNYRLMIDHGRLTSDKYSASERSDMSLIRRCADIALGK